MPPHHYRHPRIFGPSDGPVLILRSSRKYPVITNLEYVVTCIQDVSRASLVVLLFVNPPCLKCMVVPPQVQYFPKIADIYLV